MARIHGRRGLIYLDGAGGGNASPLAFQSKWEISFTTDKDDVTSFGDPNKTYVAGLPDADGSFSGFYDDSTAQTYLSAADGIARAFYLYPSSSKMTQYWYGMIFPDFKADGDVGSSVTVSSSWVAAGPINKAG
jgi:hypothetical protein